MPKAALIAFTEAFILVVLTVFLLVRSRNADIKRRVANRFMELKIDTTQAPRTIATRNPLLGRFTDELWRAGIAPSAWYPWAGMLSLLLLAAAGWWWKQAIGLLMLPLLLVIGGYAFLRWRYRKRADAMLRQMPMFLDQMIRGLGAGRTVDNAFTLATERTAVPLKEVLERVCVNMHLGVELGSALSAVARLHGLREIQLLALAIHVNQRYGGSVRDLLESLINMIRQRQQAQGELRALTSETRLSAWVLGLLPTFMAAYMMAMNPGYLETMWDDPSGRVVLTLAVALQATGALVLWRMIRSI